MALRYAVGTPFSWDGSALTKWALTSGAAGGQAVPTSVDDVFADAASGAGAITIASGNTGCRDINTTGFTGNMGGSTTINISGSLTVGAGSTWLSTSTLNLNATTTGKTITTNGKVMGGAFTFNGAGGGWQLQDNLTTNDRIITLTAGTLDLNGKLVVGQTFSSNVSTTRALISGAGGKINLTQNSGTLLNGPTLTGLTVTGNVVFDATNSGSTGTRTFSWGGTAGKTEARAVSIKISAGTNIVTLAAGSYFRDVDFTGFGGTWSGGGTVNIAGNLTLSPTMIVTMAFATNISGTSGVQIITTNGVALLGLTFQGVGGSYRLADDLNSPFALYDGTLDFNGRNVTSNYFLMFAGTKTLMIGSGTWTITDPSTAFDAESNKAGLTVAASTGRIRMTNAAAKTFDGGGFTWPTIEQAGAGALTILGGNSFADIQRTAGSVINLGAGTTTTVAALTVSNCTLQSDTPGVPATISKASGTVNLSNMTLKDITATGATFNALLSNGNVDGGGNSGINFGAPVAPTQGLLAMIQ